jgi:hypothetical protein
VKEGKSGGAGGVATTPIAGATVPGVVVVVGFVVVPVGGGESVSKLVCD